MTLTIADPSAPQLKRFTASGGDVIGDGRRPLDFESIPETIALWERVAEDETRLGHDHAAMAIKVPLQQLSSAFQAAKAQRRASGCISDLTMRKA